MLNEQQKIVTTHHAWLLDDGQGNFTGAIIPMEAPLESTNQWQAAFDALFAEAVATDPDADINGIYSIVFHNDRENPHHSGLLVTRIDRTIAEGSSRNLPSGSLGLIAVTTESSEGTRVAICALSGGITHTGALRSNRILCSIISNEGQVTKPALTREEKLAIRAIGRFLHERLDSFIERNRG